MTTIANFVDSTAEKTSGNDRFELEGDRILNINLDGGKVWTKTGSMVAYTGAIKFKREGILEHGVGRFLKEGMTGEGTHLTKAEGAGSLYLADTSKKVSILHLHNDSIFVNGNDLLAFDDGIDWDIKMMRRVSGMLAGGLFNLRLEGTGLVAITTHHDPLTLRPAPGKPVMTDPNATVAWSGTLSPEFKTDVSMRTFLGRGSGESLQMKFEGEGFVVIQPHEEVYFQNRR